MVAPHLLSPLYSVHGMALPTLQLSVPSSSGKPLKHLHRHTQRCASWVTLRYHQVAIKSNHRVNCQDCNCQEVVGTCSKTAVEVVRRGWRWGFCEGKATLSSWQAAGKEEEKCPMLFWEFGVGISRKLNCPSLNWEIWAFKMAQQVKAIADNSDDLSSIPKTYVAETENWLLQNFLWPPHMCTHSYTYTIEKCY